jgi:hypothetical protein
MTLNVAIAFSSSFAGNQVFPKPRETTAEETHSLSRRKNIAFPMNHLPF